MKHHRYTWIHSKQLLHTKVMQESNQWPYQVLHYQAICVLVLYQYVDLRTSVWWYYFTKICFNLTFLSYICNKCKILSSSRPHLIPLSRLEQWKLVVFREFSFAQWAKWWLKCNRFLAKWISQILSNIVYKSIPEKEKIWMSMQKNLWDM